MHSFLQNEIRLLPIYQIQDDFAHNIEQMHSILVCRRKLSDFGIKTMIMCIALERILLSLCNSHTFAIILNFNGKRLHRISLELFNQLISRNLATQI